MTVSPTMIFLLFCFRKKLQFQSEKNSSPHSYNVNVDILQTFIGSPDILISSFLRQIFLPACFSRQISSFRSLLFHWITSLRQGICARVRLVKKNFKDYLISSLLCFCASLTLQLRSDPVEAHSEDRLLLATGVPSALPGADLSSTAKLLIPTCTHRSRDRQPAKKCRLRTQSKEHMTALEGQETFLLITLA